jgi:Uma2 family endonuclease
MPMAATTRAWTLDDLYAMPDDGNKYEVVRGELFVTPAPTYGHESVLSRLTRILDPYVAANDLGLVLHARSALRFQGSEVEPDLMVRRRTSPDQDWETAPAPLLVVEVLSPATRRRDREQKRAVYRDAGVAEYWIVDGEGQTITAVRSGEPDVVFGRTARWWPAGVPEPLDVVLAEIFREP